MRHSLHWAGLIGLVAASGCIWLPKGITAAEPRVRRPNIIVVLMDDLRWDALGCMGNPIVQTPQIDRLAAEGTRFTNAFCTTSVCAISRACLLLGQYERRHHIKDFKTSLSPEQWQIAFPRLLKQAGYRTGMVGKWGVGPQLPTAEYDFIESFKGQGRYYEPGTGGLPGRHLTERMQRQSLQFLESCSASQPFLLQVYTKAPHCQDPSPWPFLPDPQSSARYAGVTIPHLPGNSASGFERLPEILKTSEARLRWEPRFETEAKRQQTVKDYYALISGVDNLVGALVSRLQEQKLADNTVILLTSDNGMLLGEHGLTGKWFLYEESIRLPLIVFDPRDKQRSQTATQKPAGSTAGRSVSELVLNIDLAPTILELAGVPIPEAIQGRSLLPLLHGPVKGWRTEFFYEHRFWHKRIPESEGVRGPRWKYVRYTEQTPVVEQLFDLQQDPHELQDLSHDDRYAEDLARMRDDWKRLRHAAE